MINKKRKNCRNEGNTHIMCSKNIQIYKNTKCIQLVFCRYIGKWTALTVHCTFLPSKIQHCIHTSIMLLGTSKQALMDSLSLLGHKRPVMMGLSIHGFVLKVTHWHHQCLQQSSWLDNKNKVIEPTKIRSYCYKAIQISCIACFTKIVLQKV